MQSSSPGRVGTRQNPRRGPVGQPSRGRSGGRPTRAGDPHERRPAPDGTMGAVTSETRSSVSPYAVFDRASWRALAAGSRLPLDEAELRELATLGDRIDLDEVATVYLPLAELLDLHVDGQPPAVGRAGEFLGNTTAKVPFVIAVAGSVAVGKSTTARLLQTLLSAAPGSPRVDLVTTDGFLLPNAVLEARGLLGRKGFPESYDRRALLRFLADVKSGREEVVRAGLRPPVLRHRARTRRQAVDRPDILVVEGLNVLQAGRRADGTRAGGLPVRLLRLLRLRRRRRGRHPALVRRALPGAAPDGVPGHHRLLPPVRRRSPTSRPARRRSGIWAAVNGPNLRSNIAPTRSRARLVLQKAGDHAVRRVLLRKL